MNTNGRQSPARERRGILIEPAALAQQRRPLVQDSTRKPLIDELPEIREICFGFERITVPANGTLQNLNFGTVAYYRLGRIDWNRFGQDCFVNKVVVDMLSADVDGTCAGTSATVPATPVLPWGTKFGRGATIVLGYDLVKGDGIGGSGWDIGTARGIPAMDRTSSVTGDWDSAVAADPDGDFAGNVLCSFSWTIGSMSDAQPYKQEKTRSFGAFGRRIGRDDHLDICFAVPGEALANAGTFYGHASVHVYVGLTRESGSFKD